MSLREATQKILNEENLYILPKTLLDALAYQVSLPTTQKPKIKAPREKPLLKQRLGINRKRKGRNKMEVIREKGRTKTNKKPEKKVSKVLYLQMGSIESIHMQDHGFAQRKREEGAISGSGSERGMK